MYEAERNLDCGELQVIGLKGIGGHAIGGHAILAFLETPGTKVQIMMIIQFGNSCVQV